MYGLVVYGSFLLYMDRCVLLYVAVIVKVAVKVILLLFSVVDRPCCCYSYIVTAEQLLFIIDQQCGIIVIAIIIAVDSIPRGRGTVIRQKHCTCRIIFSNSTCNNGTGTVGVSSISLRWRTGTCSSSIQLLLPRPPLVLVLLLLLPNVVASLLLLQQQY